jgi:cold-inducible RNA-binding protein
MARKRYVGNLHYETAEQELQSLFSGVGTVASVNLIRDMTTGRARGLAFVEMTSEDARTAIDQLNNHQLGGRSLTVNEARQKPQGSGAFEGGGGSGFVPVAKRRAMQWARRGPTGTRQLQMRRTSLSS